MAYKEEVGAINGTVEIQFASFLLLQPFVIFATQLSVVLLKSSLNQLGLELHFAQLEKISFVVTFCEVKTHDLKQTDTEETRFKFHEKKYISPTRI